EPRPPTVSYTLSLHDALPIWEQLRARLSAAEAEAAAAAEGHAGEVAALELALAESREEANRLASQVVELEVARDEAAEAHARHRSEEHTSELQSRSDLVCRLL